MRWVEEDIGQRKEHLAELLALVRLPQLPTAYFLNNVKKHPLISVSLFIIRNIRCAIMICWFESITECCWCRQCVSTLSALKCSSLGMCAMSRSCCGCYEWNDASSNRSRTFERWMRFIVISRLCFNRFHFNRFQRTFILIRFALYLRAYNLLKKRMTY